MREGINPTSKPSSTGCVDCLATGGWWLHLRRCAECGQIGCCDNSPNQPQNTMRAPAIPSLLASNTERIGFTITTREISLQDLSYQAPMHIPWTNLYLDRLDGCPENGNRSFMNNVLVGLCRPFVT